MISVIICAAGRERLEKVRENIAGTIGAEYELLAIDNTVNPRGICEVYNEGARAAKFSILCFVHDDVSFTTPGWGHRIIAHFDADAALGIAGLAGGQYKCNAPTGWWSGLENADGCNIGQRRPNGSVEMVVVKPAGMEGNTLPVRTLDGVLLVMRKNVWEELPFNETQLKGFHFYDMDISLRVSARYKAVVIFDVDLVHFSYGNFGDRWLRECFCFHREVNSIALPCSTGMPLEPAIERTAIQKWMLRLRREKYTLANKLEWCRVARVWGQPGNWPYIAAFLLNINLQSFKRRFS